MRTEAMSPLDHVITIEREILKPGNQGPDTVTSRPTCSCGWRGNVAFAFDPRALMADTRVDTCGDAWDLGLRHASAVFEADEVFE